MKNEREGSRWQFVADESIIQKRKGEAEQSQITSWTDQLESVSIRFYTIFFYLININPKKTRMVQKSDKRRYGWSWTHGNRGKRREVGEIMDSLTQLLEDLVGSITQRISLIVNSPTF